MGGGGAERVARATAPPKTAERINITLPNPKRDFSAYDSFHRCVVAEANIWWYPFYCIFRMWKRFVCRRQKSYVSIVNLERCRKRRHEHGQTNGRRGKKKRKKKQQQTYEPMRNWCVLLGQSSVAFLLLFLIYKLHRSTDEWWRVRHSSSISYRNAGHDRNENFEMDRNGKNRKFPSTLVYNSRNYSRKHSECIYALLYSWPEQCVVRSGWVGSPRGVGYPSESISPILRQIIHPYRHIHTSARGRNKIIICNKKRKRAQKKSNGRMDRPESQSQSHRAHNGTAAEAEAAAAASQSNSGPTTDRQKAVMENEHRAQPPNPRLGWGAAEATENIR